MDGETLSEIKGMLARSRLGKALAWVIELPKAVDTIRAARTPTGRAVKTLIFGLSMAAPLGILVIALLFWHGSRISGRSLHPVVA